MKLSNTEIQEIHTILEKYCNSKEARSMKMFLSAWQRKYIRARYVCYKSMLLLK